MTKLMTIEERNANLDQAAELLQEVGWNQFTYGFDRTGNKLTITGVCSKPTAEISSFCVRGALVHNICKINRDVCEISRDISPEVNALDRVARRKCNLTLTDYNDAPGRTVEEIIKWLSDAKSEPMLLETP